MKLCTLSFCIISLLAFDTSTAPAMVPEHTGFEQLFEQLCDKDISVVYGAELGLLCSTVAIHHPLEIEAPNPTAMRRFLRTALAAAISLGVLSIDQIYPHAFARCGITSQYRAWIIAFLTTSGTVFTGASLLNILNAISYLSEHAPQELIKSLWQARQNDSEKP